MLELIKSREAYNTGESAEPTGPAITETDVAVHAGHPGDFFPIYSDMESGKAQPFSTRIANGMMVYTTAVAPTVTTFNPVSLLHGCPRLRFLTPVIAKDTIKNCVRIAGKKATQKRQGYGSATEQLTVTKHAGETVLVTGHICMAECHK